MPETLPLPVNPVIPPPLPTQKKSEGMKTVLLMGGAVILIGLSFGLGYWYKGQAKLQTPTPTSTNAPAFTKETITFTGKKLNISFEYLGEWGEVKEEITPIGDAQNYHGNNYRLSFSKNPYFTLVGASKDSSSPGVGGACPISIF